MLQRASGEVDRMHDRLRRIAATGLTTNELANLLGTSDQALIHWIDDELSIENADVVEVALSLLELHLGRRSPATVTQSLRPPTRPLPSASPAVYGTIPVSA